MINNCDVFIYLSKFCNEDELKTINYLKQNNKKIVILTFNDIQIENFYNYNNYK